MSDRNLWEVPVPPEVFDLAAAVPLLPEAADDEGDAEATAAARAAVIEQVAIIVANTLTDKQRRIVELYFYDGRSQADVAAALGVSQQTVSRQLFGVIRNGRRVGGAVRKLRQACERAGLDPSQWV